MTRGNQRELARAKNQRKQQEQSKGKKNNDGLTLEQRKHRDAEIMREKQKIKEDPKQPPSIGIRKKRRVVLTLSKKIKLLDKLKNGEIVASIATCYGMNE